MRNKLLFFLLFLCLSSALLSFSYVAISIITRLKPQDNTVISDNYPNTSNLKNEKILVVLISLDGLGGEFINSIDSPYLFSTLSDYTSTLNALTNTEAETVPSHVSMITGLTPEHHGIHFNSVNALTPNLDKLTLFDYANSSGYKYYAFVNKEKLLFLLNGKTGSNVKFSDVKSDQSIKQVDELVNPSTDNMFVFVHLNDMDSAGHSYGWGSNEYKASLKSLDANLEILIRDLDTEFSYYNRYYIITADHSGDGKYNGDNCPKCLQIPIILINRDDKRRYYIDPEVQYHVYDNACIALDLMKIHRPAIIDCTK